MVWLVALPLSRMIAGNILASISGLTSYIIGLKFGGLFIGLLQWQHFNPAGGLAGPQLAGDFNTGLDFLYTWRHLVGRQRLVLLPGSLQ